MTQPNLSTRAYDRTRNVKLARTIADLTECEEIQLMHLAEELHAPQSTEIDAQHCVLSQVSIHLIRKQYKGRGTYVDPHNKEWGASVDPGDQGYRSAACYLSHRSRN
jgi:hypothetical protein